MLTERAPKWPRCGPTPAAANQPHRRPVAEALHARYWQPNPEGRLGVLVADCDHADPLTAVIAGTAPAPTALVWHEATGHAHALYALAAPVARGGASHAAPQRYAEAVRYGLNVALGADLGYTHDLSRGPLAEGHTLEAISGRVWTLDELAAAVTLPPRQIHGTDVQHVDGRNVALFQHLRGHLRGWPARTSDLAVYLCHHGDQFNALLARSHPSGALPLSEVRATVKSVTRYGQAHKHTEARRTPKLPGAVDRSQVYSADRPPPASAAEQQARQAAAGQMTAARRREATRAEIRAGMVVLQQQGQRITAPALLLVTGLSRATLKRHADLWKDDF